MKQDKYVIINGQQYDGATGMPIAGSKQKPADKPSSQPEKRATASAKTIHARPQKSKTLDRRSAKPPKQHGSSQAVTGRKGRSMDIAPSKHISKFGPKNIISNSAKAIGIKPSTNDKPDIGPTKHPMTAQAESKSKPKQPVNKPSNEVKKDAIAKAMDQAKEASKKPKNPNKKRRLFFWIGASLLAISIIVVFAYTQLPSLSVGVASMRADIEATYPSHQPAGYSFAGTTYQDGEVTIQFESNSGSGQFNLTQTRGGLTPTELRDRVEQSTGGDFTVTKDSGLTIYTYNNSATWTNAGIVYLLAVEDGPQLAGEQIRRIAESLR
jgi:hypothetical protein